jgi:hypothetical protein
MEALDFGRGALGSRGLRGARDEEGSPILVGTLDLIDIGEDCGDVWLD